MEIILNEIPAVELRFSARNERGKEIARAFLIIAKNDLHPEPFGLLEDVEVLPEERGHRISEELVHRVIEEAKSRGCYKVLATSRHERPWVHQIYERLGAQDHGKEFRWDL